MTNNDFELENMRQQMETLKKKLDKQEIVNDRFIRHSMEKTASNISRKYNIVMLLGILMVPYFYWVFIKLSGFSMTFWIASSIFMLVCVGATYYNSRNLNDSNMMTTRQEVRCRLAVLWCPCSHPMVWLVCIRDLSR